MRDTVAMRAVALVEKHIPGSRHRISHLPC